MSQQLVDNTGAIRIRSDVERKRLFNIKSGNSIPSDLNANLYSAQASRKTYEKLLELASLIIAAGYSVIVDAAFLKYEQRQQFQLLAGRLNVSYFIVEITAATEILRKRIIARKGDVSDANIEVLEYQLSNFEALHETEKSRATCVNTEGVIDLDDLYSLLSK